MSPPADISILSKATLLDPLDIEIAGTSDVEVSHLIIEPGGATGSRVHPGPVIVTVVGGTGSRYHLENGSCDRTPVPVEVAFLEPAGQVDEIRNEGAVPLQLHTTSLAPAGAAPVSPPPAGFYDPRMAPAACSSTANGAGEATNGGAPDALILDPNTARRVTSTPRTR